MKHGRLIRLLSLTMAILFCTFVFLPGEISTTAEGAINWQDKLSKELLNAIEKASEDDKIPICL